MILAILLAIGWITNSIASQESPHPLAVRTIVETQIVRITVVVTATPMPGDDTRNDFDPAASRLTFQWDQPQSVQADGSEFVKVDVFADGAFLGPLQIRNPRDSSCERSSDGRHLAFVERSDLPPFPLTRMSVLTLPHLQVLSEPLPRGSRYGNDVAFSPDSRYLAFWGCGGSSRCGVFLLDLMDQEVTLLLPGRYAGYFTWSPDGNEIAMLSADGNLTIVDIIGGQISYRQSMDWVTKEVPLDAPVKNWGVQFPPRQSDLHGCEAPGEG
jgi:WD40 repeat protein